MRREKLSLRTDNRGKILPQRRISRRNQIIILRRKLALLFILIAIIIVLICLVFLVSAEKKETMIPKTADSKEVIKENDEKVYTKYFQPLFVGDSRTVGMANALDEEIDYQARSGSTYYYFTTLEDRILNSGSDCIVIGFGVNDLGNVDDYVEFANYLGENLDKPVFFLTVNPVDEEICAYNGYYTKNSRIEDFNKSLYRGADYYTVIDTYEYLTDTGFNTADGLHYDENTYKKIYAFLMDELKSKVN